jgi:hypothetical protein
MRTKTLLLGAALGAFGLAGAFAQVYSVNAVGYVTVVVPAGKFQMVANPLDAGTGNNTVGKLFAAPPEGTVIFKFAGNAYEPANVFELGEWSNPAQTFGPGEGAFIKVPAGVNYTNVFVGEVQQKAASNKQLAAGFNMTGSLVPQAGLLTTDLKYPADEGDVVYQFDPAAAGPGAYKPAFVYELGEWGPSQPSLAVAEAVFIKPAAARNWVRDFDVNAP